MKTLRLLGLIALLCAGFGCGMADESNTPQAQAATQAAAAWFTLTDAGNYTGSWDSAASYFRNAVSKEDWVKSMTAFRAPMGKLVSRQVKQSRNATTLPGVPDGQYVLVRYDTSFENKKSALETATVMLETNNEWRVSGYFIQ